MDTQELRPGSDTMNFAENRVVAIAAAYMMALSQGGLMRGGQPHYVPSAPQPRKQDTHDAERIAQAEAKRARKAAKRAPQMEDKP